MQKVPADVAAFKSGRIDRGVAPTYAADASATSHKAEQPVVSPLLTSRASAFCKVVQCGTLRSVNAARRSDQSESAWQMPRKSMRKKRRSTKIANNCGCVKSWRDRRAEYGSSPSRPTNSAKRTKDSGDLVVERSVDICGLPKLPRIPSTFFFDTTHTQLEKISTEQTES